MDKIVIFLLALGSKSAFAYIRGLLARNCAHADLSASNIKMAIGMAYGDIGYLYNENEIEMKELII